MSKEKYNKIRTTAIFVFGVFMLAMGIMLIFVSGPVYANHLQKVCTEYVSGKVTDVKGGDVWFYYEIPGEGEEYYVCVPYSGDVLKKGSEVRVFYNPDDWSEKYYENLEESPWIDMIYAIFGIAIGTGSILIAVKSKKNKAVNRVIDVIDDNV